jgi:hypothetical protein
MIISHVSKKYFPPAVLSYNTQGNRPTGIAAHGMRRTIMSVAEVQIIETCQEPFLARVPGSKSLTNRALILAAQATHGVRIRNALHCDDTLRLAAALDAFDGVTVKRTADGFAVDRQAEKIVAPAESLDMAGAGTPARWVRPSSQPEAEVVARLVESRPG